MIFESINECDPLIKKTLYNNMIISGGNSLLSGLCERLEKEVDLLCPQKGITKVISG